MVETRLVCCVINNWVLSILCYIFCFKQKTAYEMRISDWSSDVCSSDLHELTTRLSHQLTALMLLHQYSNLNIQVRIPNWQETVSSLEEIGRASCRERVCQYV